MIGRSDDVDVQLEDCSVSHYHCKIDNLGGVVVVRDLGSRLGTYVNGDDVYRKRAAVRRPVDLGHGPLLRRASLGPKCAAGRL